ncbi:MAG: tRNA (adenosine(37)-N6)-dimethylallyltransferase MiaA [Betaproteobacteria bacterium RIFCSPLOWO2_12_FULL_62_13b]|nr:MAG: tRNA (adenosine(37)-N6)-dimethylallyltransferase MiaA [Betaproteobacteria bacterium RIFCSPLOWO2_12_FULL_62_13b]
MGPTASGKSRVALELAQRLPVEIVSVDSAQVYRGMDIGTAKPSAAERASVPHHLIDILPPTEAYSAALFRADALRVIGQIRSRARLPLLVGGTMLYFKALLEGLSRLPSANAQIRAEIEAEAQDLGWPALHTRLAAVDPDTAARLKPRDSQRIQRALEVYRITGEPMSRLLFHPPPLAGEGREGAFLSIALLPADRARLHQRISARLTEMLSRGLVEEVEALRQKYALSSELPSMRSVGYRQVWQHLEGELDRDELKDRAIYATRQLAKRQMTWLRSWPECSVFDCFAPALSGKLYEVINRAGARPGSI